MQHNICKMNIYFGISSFQGTIVLGETKWFSNVPNRAVELIYDSQNLHCMYDSFSFFPIECLDNLFHTHVGCVRPKNLSHMAHNTKQCITDSVM